MSYINQTILLGNIVRKPELSYTPSGKAVCKFSLAVSNRFKGKDDIEIDRPLFIDVTVWNKQGEATAEYMDKGDQVFVLGRLTLDQWEDKNGQKHSKIKVVAQRVIFGVKKKHDIQNSSASGAGKESQGTVPAPEDESQE